MDPIKVAEGRYLADESTIHYGLIPRTNRGIFTINELPDLAERIQVGLLNILEERDVQVRGYTLRLPLDLFVVASANPEDYTNRGRIITPLKDRLGSQIRTHYPRTIEHEIAIMLQERTPLRAATARSSRSPTFMLEIVAELSHLARRAPEISQRSGVSVRVSISNLETLLANADQRAIRLGESSAAPRVSDLGAIIPSTTGKIELETMGDEAPEERIIDRLLGRAIHVVFARRVDSTSWTWSRRSSRASSSRPASCVPSREYVRWMHETPGLGEAVARLGVGESPAAIASAVEFLLEGLHLHRRLNKEPRRHGWRALPRLSPTGRHDLPGAPLPPPEPPDEARRAAWPRRGPEATASGRPGSRAAPTDTPAGTVASAWRTSAGRDPRCAVRRPARGERPEHGATPPPGARHASARGCHGRRSAGPRRAPGAARRSSAASCWSATAWATSWATCARSWPPSWRPSAGASSGGWRIGGDPALRRLATEMAARRGEQLDGLPQDPGERIKALQEYDFLEPAARERFEQLLARLRDSMLDGIMEGMADAIRNATPEQLAANREMVRDLEHCSAAASGRSRSRARWTSSCPPRRLLSGRPDAR